MKLVISVFGVLCGLALLLYGLQQEESAVDSSTVPVEVDLAPEPIPSFPREDVASSKKEAENPSPPEATAPAPPPLEEPLEPEGMPTIESRLDVLFGEAIGDEGINITLLDQVLEELAGAAVIDPSSITRDADGKVVSARLAIEGSSLVGEVNVIGDYSHVSFLQAPDSTSGFALRELRVRVQASGDLDGGGGSSIQHHPNTRVPANRVLSDGEILTCGWGVMVGGGTTQVSHLGARASEDGQAWIIGGLSKGLDYALEGAENLRPYDAWAKALREGLGEQ